MASRQKITAVPSVGQLNVTDVGRPLVYRVIVPDELRGGRLSPSMLAPISAAPASVDDSEDSEDGSEDRLR